MKYFACLVEEKAVVVVSSLLVSDWKLGLANWVAVTAQTVCPVNLILEA